MLLCLRFFLAGAEGVLVGSAAPTWGSMAEITHKWTTPLRSVLSNIIAEERPGMTREKAITFTVAVCHAGKRGRPQPNSAEWWMRVCAAMVDEELPSAVYDLRVW